MRKQPIGQHKGIFSWVSIAKVSYKPTSTSPGGTHILMGSQAFIAVARLGHKTEGVPSFLKQALLNRFGNRLSRSLASCSAIAGVGVAGIRENIEEARVEIGRALIFWLRGDGSI